MDREVKSERPCTDLYTEFRASQLPWTISCILCRPSHFEPVTFSSMAGCMLRAQLYKDIYIQCSQCGANARTANHRATWAHIQSV